VYRVILCCVEVEYTHDDDTRTVTVLGGRPALGETEWAAVQDAAAAQAALSDDDGDEDEEAAAAAVEDGEHACGA
jgi:hypothetical protein